MRLAMILLVLTGCVAPSSDCLEVPGSVAPLRGGGWDANGTSLRGGGWDLDGASPRGGWDHNGTEPGAELEGVTLADPNGVPVEVIEGRLRDATGVEHTDVSLTATTSEGTVPITATLARIESGVALYDVTVDGVRVCDGPALFANGAWSASGAHEDGGVTLVCARGVIAKCMLWGYAPWVVGDATHAACTRMVRADYCGDGHAWTREGTMIDVSDPAGVQELAGGMAFEAGWGPDGAVCVRTTRWDVTSEDGASIVPPCWDALPPCADADGAFAAGALVANGTLHEPIAACR